MEFGAATTTLSKKLSNGYGVSGRSAYDGVFAAPVKLRAPSFSFRLEDYRDVFGSSRASSIPILELPELNERKQNDDVRRSKLDYLKVFGGFGNLEETATPLEELIAEPTQNRKVSFTDGASIRSEAKGGNRSHREDPTNYSKESSIPSQPSNDTKKINMSYHKFNQGSENGTNGTTHVGQLHAVPAYTCVIKEVNPLKVNRVNKLPVAQDAYSSIHCNEGIKDGGHCTKSFPGPSPDNDKKQSSKNGVEVKNRPDSIDLFFDVCEVSNGSNGKDQIKVPPSETVVGNLDNHNGEAMKSMATKSQASKSKKSEGAAGENQSSNNGVKVKGRSDSIDLIFDACEISNGSNGTNHIKVPPSETVAVNLDIHNGDAVGSMATKSKASKSDRSVGSAGADSPSYLDDMVDSNSEAAASVAALRKAIEEAQVRMKVAKESMRRKKGFPDRVKRKSGIDLKAKKIKEDKNTYKTMSLEEINTRQAFGEMDAFPQVSSDIGKATMRIEQVRSDIRAKEMFVAEEAMQETLKKLKSTQAECKEEVEQKADGNAKVLEIKEVENNKKELHIENIGRNASEKLEECDHTTVVVKEEQENNREKVSATNKAGACEELFDETRHMCQEVVDETKLVQKTLDNETTNKRLKANGDGEVEKKVSPFHESEDCRSNLSEQGLVIEDENEVACKLEGDGKEIKGSFELEDCQINFKAIQELREVENIAQEQKGSEEIVEVSSELEECELPESLKLIDNSKRACSPHGSDLKSLERVKENLGCLENRKRGNEAGFVDVNCETEHSCQRDGTKNTFSNVYVQEILEEIVDHIHDKEEIYLRITKDSESDGNERVQDSKVSRNELEGATHQMEESEGERKDNKEPVEVIRVTQTDTNYEEIQAEEADKTTETSSSYEPTEKLSKTQVSDSAIEHDEALEVTSEVYSHDLLDDIMVASDDASFEHQEKYDEPESVQEKNDLREKHTVETSAFIQGALELDEAVNQMQNTSETVAFEGAAPNILETDMKVRQNQDQCVEKSENDCNLELLCEETIPESVEIRKDAKEAGVTLDEEIDENRSNSSNEENSFYNEHNTEASQIPTMSERKSSSFKEEEVKTIHSNLENHQAALTMEEKESNGNSQKVVLEKEAVKKIDDAKEREREREKEKLAVERAIREARSRAFAEARERAALERAAAEARQKNISNGREGLGKTTGHAIGKTPAEKAAMEAKLKAERAAVERATAEVRARALERALSEKAASESRNKSDKSVAEQLFGASRDNGMKQNFHSKSFSYGVRDSTDVFDGANGDSAERCKARSERHQRIGERVAKALAEKNLHDRLVQKEQEERNRIAEALDADVKRWSSGKTGNLRALLSTLQYILGPDSGWQPIPLTDMVATTAVKKAYRKATLFVHPDKLQQRGASIKQKYICEKVFDLLKEAWNRFNMEER